jgi:penicillin-binding protein 2
MSRAARWRLATLSVVCVTLLIVLAVRLWYVQVASGKSYASLASQEQVRAVVLPPSRGEILDVSGRTLVASRASLVVTVNPTALSRQADGGRAEMHQLAALLGMKYRLLHDRLRLCTAGVHQPCWPGSPYQPIPVREDVPERLGLQIMENQGQFPGVVAQVQPVVSYPRGGGAAQVLGYMQPITAQQQQQRHLTLTGIASADLAGQSGLEAQYDAALRGTAGTRRVAVNAAGTVTGTVSTNRPVAGDDLVTSIDAKIQADTQRALANAIRKAHAEGNREATTGAAVVMTTSGRVVAMASYPTYSPAIWTRGVTQREYRRLVDPAGGEPILNRATQGQYAPGSTWKVTSAAAAVAAGYSLAGPYDCPGSVNIGGRTFLDDNPANSGPMDMHTALVQSCDTVFYELAYDIWRHDNPAANRVTSAHAPVQEMQKMELGWGFGRPTGVDLPAELGGAVPTRAWLYRYYSQNKKIWCQQGKQNGTYAQQIAYQDCHYGNIWEPGQAVNAAIGQGYVTVTPLQLASAYAALANGGTLYSPRIGSALVRPDGRLVRRITPQVAGHLPVKKPVLAYIRRALADVVTQGTAAPAFSGFPLNRVCVAGKTGTAQVAGKLATSVFASYAPCAHPKFVIVMMIPASGYGADVSAPAVRQIWDGIYGLEGHRAALPNGTLPSRLPTPSATPVPIPAPAAASAGRQGRR